MKETGARIIARTPNLAMCFSTSYLLSKYGVPVCRLAEPTEVKTRCTPAVLAAPAATIPCRVSASVPPNGVVIAKREVAPSSAFIIAAVSSSDAATSAARRLGNRVESAEDRRVRIIALTPRGKDLIVPAFRKHSGQMRRVFSELTEEELHCIEVALKRLGKRAAALTEPIGQRDESKRLPMRHAGKPGQSSFRLRISGCIIVPHNEP